MSQEFLPLTLHDFFYFKFNKLYKIYFSFERLINRIPSSNELLSEIDKNQNNTYT